MVQPGGRGADPLRPLSTGGDGRIRAISQGLRPFLK